MTDQPTKQFYFSANIHIKSAQIEDLQDTAEQFSEDVVSREIARNAAMSTLIDVLAERDSTRGNLKDIERVRLTIIIDAPTGRSDDITFANPEATVTK